MPAPFEGLVLHLVHALVDRPDEVQLETREVDGGRIYELKLASSDIGKVIGRDGRTIHALRTLLSTAAARKGEKIRLEVLDDRRPKGPAPMESSPDAP